MSKIYREEHPLLCDDPFEDDHYSPQYQKFDPILYRGRAKHSLRGAAAIFTRWPDHWTSFLTYWWIILGMIAIITLIILNILFAFSIVPPDTINPLNQRAVTKTEYQLHEPTRLPEVYMHLFKNYSDEIDLHQYLPYIEIISNKFNRFKYYLIIVMNDTSIDNNGKSAEINNEIALNSLWTKEKGIKQKALDNDLINIKYVTLSEYMNNSPMENLWRTLSPQLIEFLVRAISVWDKGGIAFNPTILTPRSPHAIYIEKLQNILQDYKRFTKRLTKDVTSKKNVNRKSNKNVKHKVNNIRDIIDALDSNDMTPNSTQEMLAEAENMETLRMTRSEQKLFSVTENYGNDKNSQSPYDIKIGPKMAHNLNKDDLKRLEPKRIPFTDKSNGTTETEQVLNSTSTMSLLPLFLDFLFNNKPNIRQSPQTQELNSKNITKINRISVNKIKEKSSENIRHSITDSLKDLQHTNDKYAPMIVSTKYVHDKIEKSISLNMPSKFENINQLTIDLKGNIIATETPCHAFIGTVFSNAVHHESVTITDFIIAELSTFCKGVLSSCVGIDLILL